MSLTSDVINNIGYEGIVTITYKHKGYKHSIKVHNEGTVQLGDLISIAISGDQRNINSLQNRSPSLLGFEMQLNEEEWRPLIAYNIPITSRVWGNSVPTSTEDSKFIDNPNVIGKNRFSATIPSGAVNRGNTPNNAMAVRLKLLNSLGQDLAYFTELKDEKERKLPLLYTALTSGQDALIDWTMYILNYTSKGV